MSEELEDSIVHAREWLANPGAAAIEPGEETATRFARAVVKLADTCVIGFPCERHGRALESMRSV